MIEKIISGGQTGVDRAGLNVAIEFGLSKGGWAPKGFIAEDGFVPKFYGLKEFWIDGYPARTEQNIIDSDGTVTFSNGAPWGTGTKLTISTAKRLKKPHIHIDLEQPKIDNAAKLYRWLTANNISVLNVAGTRASHDRNAGHATRKVLSLAIQAWKKILERPGQCDSVRSTGETCDLKIGHLGSHSSGLGHCLWRN